MRSKIRLTRNSTLRTFFFAGLTFCFVNSPAQIQAAAVGLSPGKVSAQPSGGLSYEMPIVVAPGTAGMQPKLSFQYSSGGRNGALGVGWSMGGISAISRAPQTPAQDGKIHGVDMTFADRYSLDGQRLIALTGTDGYAGTDYRTEINSFTKVVSNGQSGQGPATFTAWTKSGLIYTFGGPNNASFIPPGRTDGTILTWLVSKVQDHAGNYMTFLYTAEGNLSSINYAMNDSAGLGSYASVVLTYEARPDTATGYVSGYAVSMTQRLKQVTCNYSQQLVRQYDLSYVDGDDSTITVSPTTKKSRLGSITESAMDTGGLVSYPPTKFTWDKNTNSINFSSSLFSGNQQDNTHWAQGDFDGDGIVDMARMRDGVINIYRVSDLRTPVSSFSTSPHQDFDSVNDTWLQGDFNGDGKLDLVRVHGSDGNPIRFTTFTKTGTSFTQATITDAGGLNFYRYRIFMAIDANGDGKLDIVCINGVDPQSSTNPDLKITVFQNNGNGTFTPGVWPVTSTDSSGYTALDNGTRSAAGSDKCFRTDRWLVADFNGDGLPDLARVWEKDSKNTVRIFANQNGSFSAANRIFKKGSFYEANDSTQPVAYIWLTGDFNGDGLADIVRVPKAANPDGAQTADVFLSTGAISSSATPAMVLPPIFTEPGQPWASLQVGEQAKIQTGDYNADGRSDIVILKDHVKGTPSGFQSPEGGDVGLGGPIDANDDVSGLTAFLDDPVITALRAAENINFTFTAPPQLPTPTPIPTPNPVPIIIYPSGSEADAVWYTSSSTAAASSTPYTYSLTRAIYLSSGVGFYKQVLTDDSQMEINSYSVPNFGKWFAADFNGDGKEDIVRKFTTTDSSGNTKVNFNLYLNNLGYQDLLRTVTDGMGVKTSINYEPLTGINGISVFQKSNNAVAPAIDLVVPMPVVASITYDDGRGAAGSSNYSVSYFYTGLKADPLRGMLGFESIQVTDNRPVDGYSSAVLCSRSWFKQGFPFTGMAEHVINFLDFGGGSTRLLTDTTTTYALGPTENGSTRVKFPYAQNSRAQSWDLIGSQINDTQTIVQRDDHEAIDAYGNTWGSVVKTKNLPNSAFFVKTTKSSYNINLSDWCVGEMTGSTVDHDAPGQPRMTRTSGFGYSPANCQVNTETVEPTGTNWMRTDYEFDAFGNTKKSTVSGNDMSPAGTTRVTQTIYDTRGRFLETTTNALGHIEAKEYDQRFGAVTKVTGPNNLSDTAQYDGFSRKKLATRLSNTPYPINTVTTYEWVSGNSNAPNAPPNSVYLVRETPDDGPQSIVYFDRLGREVRKQTLDFKNRPIFVDTTYDYRGRKFSVTKPYYSTPITAFTFYDALGRVIQVQVPSVDENGTSVMTYTNTSYNGLVTTMTNPKGQPTTTTKDAAGHVVKVQDALTGYINYTYDAVGQLIQTTDAAGNTTTIGYDVRGRKRSVNDPDLGLWTYDYYSTGELKWQKDAKNQQVNFQYDQLGRIKRRDDPNTDYTIWTYDYYTDSNRGRGKLRSVTFTPATGSQLAPYSNTISYDSLSRPSSQSTLIAGTTYANGTGYDGFSRPLTLTYPTGFQVKNVYGTNGYLTDIKSPDGTKTYWTQREADAEGHITEEQYGNGIITDRVYIPENGLLKNITSGVGVSTGVQNLEYRFDVLGNLMKRKDSNQTIGGSVLTENFTYDSLNRLRTAQVTGQPLKNFTYDQISSTTKSLGNIAHKDDVGDYTYDPVHKHAVRTAGNSAVATYDANGNMMSGFGRTITWTWFNMPERIQNANASSYFTYDPDHNRITQRNAGQNGLVVTTYVGGFFESVDKDNEVESRHYISSPTGRIAVYAKHQNKQTYAITYDTKYLHKDHLGSVDVVTNESAAVIERDSFDAWGFRRTTNWQGQQPSTYRSTVSRGFTDHEELDDFGLVHMNGRIYDPGIGRFLSADPFIQAPIQTQNFNRYSYVVNNPLSFTDPSGFNIFGDFFNWLVDTLGPTGAQIVIGVIAVATVISFQFYVMPAVISMTGIATAGSLSATVIAAAGAGFAGGFTATILSGASLGEAFQVGLISGTTAALTAGVIGPMMHSIDASTPLGFLEKATAHGVTGGLLNAASSKLQNGSFRDGLLAGFVSSVASPFIDAVKIVGQAGIALRTVLSAAVGGTAAELGGGKFANGAVTAAFLRLYNEESQSALKRGQSRAVTENERKQLLDPIYHGSIDYDEVRIFNKNFWLFQRSDMMITPNGDIYAGKLYYDDYTKAPLDIQAVFVHEFVHVWQWQHHVVVWLTGPFDRKYEYSFIPGKRFTTYGLEQQGAIVEDYFLATHPPGHMINAINNPTPSQLNSIFPFGN